MQSTRFIIAFIVALLATSVLAQTHKTVPGRPLSEMVSASRGPIQPGADKLWPTITWGGDAASFLGVELKGIFAQRGLSYQIAHNDDVVDQTTKVIRGEQVYFRGTLGMDVLADEAVRKAGLHLVPIVALTRSTGGDAVVARAGIKSPSDLRGKKIAVQYPGPHVYFLAKMLKDARVPLSGPGAPTIVYYPELTIPMDDTPDIVDPVTAFTADSSIDAVMCIIPDVDILTGAEGPAGAHMLYSTRTAQRVIYDVVSVRSDYFANNRSQVENAVRAMLSSTEAVQALWANKAAKQTDFSQLTDRMSQSFGLSPDESGGMIGDCTFANHNGNYHFFSGVGQTRNLANITKEMMVIFNQMGLLRTTWTVASPGWDWTKLGSGLQHVAIISSSGSATQSVASPPSSPRYDEAALERLVTGLVAEPTSDVGADGKLFEITLLFAPNAKTFDIAKYTAEFQEALEYMQTYEGAVVSFTGHSDPRGIQRAKEKYADHPAKAQLISKVRQLLKDLSVQRANNAKTAFLQYCRQHQFQIDQSSIVAVGVGQSRPAHPLPSSGTLGPRQNAENRRVVVELIQIEAELDDVLSGL